MTITILALLALGMSIDTALFSFVHSFSVQPPPGIPRGEGLVRIQGAQTAPWGGQIGRSFSYEELQEYQRLTDHFTDVAGWTRDHVKVDVGDDEGLRALSEGAMFVTEDYFPVLGVQPILGAGLPKSESADAATLQVAVIGHAAWEQLFGRDPAVIGSSLEVNGVPFTIVGVAPPRFEGIWGIDGYRALQFALWLPLSNRRLVLPDASADVEILSAAGRLRSGVTRHAATSAVTTVAARAGLEGIPSPQIRHFSPPDSRESPQDRSVRRRIALTSLQRQGAERFHCVWPGLVRLWAPLKTGLLNRQLRPGQRTDRRRVAGRAPNAGTRRIHPRRPLLGRC